MAAKYPKAMAKLDRDWQALTAFYAFPLAMAYKLLDAAQARWRRFNGHELIADVLDGIVFKDG